MKTLRELKEEFEKSGRYIKVKNGKHIGFGGSEKTLASSKKTG